jgi:carbonic anhydrase
MTVTNEYLANNREFAKSFTGPLPMPPSRQIAVVACMDARLNVYKLLGVDAGEAHVIRNAGGVITDDEFKRQIHEETDIKPEWSPESFNDIAVDVKQSLQRVKRNPFLPQRDQVRGFIFDVATGLLHEVHE